MDDDRAMRRFGGSPVEFPTGKMQCRIYGEKVSKERRLRTDGKSGLRKKGADYFLTEKERNMPR